jgi:hypothetical protein
MRKPSKKHIEDKAETAFYKLGDRIQFNTWDLGKISKAYVDEYVKEYNEVNAEKAMGEVIEKYRKN